MQPFRNRIAQYTALADEAWGPFSEMATDLQSYEMDEDIICASEPADNVFIMVEGWAIRYRVLEDGRRQIVNFMLPGDIFDLQSLADLKADHSVTTVTPATVIKIKSEKFLRLLRQSTELAATFWWASVQEESILREQIVRIGRRSAQERIGHLLLELERRFNIAIGKETTHMPLPLSRTELADTLGLTSIHVSRTMSSMRRSGLIEEVDRNIRILDREKLSKMCQFDLDYLHLRTLDFSTEIEANNNSVLNLG
ncbi:MAG: Crp/Fnr family transcriptional regulator [Pseudomonadota bacterium]